MGEKIKWLALGYNLPANPSKNRVYIWRKLKEFGAEYYKPGVAVLPNTKMSLTRLGVLCEKVKEMGGEASLVELSFLSYQDEQEMVNRFKKQVMDELSCLREDCLQYLSELKISGTKTKEGATRVQNMLTRFKKANEKDFFGAGAGAEVEQGLDNIMDSLRNTAEDLANRFSETLDKLSQKDKG